MSMVDALQRLLSATHVRREDAPYEVCRLHPGSALDGVVRLTPPPLCLCVEPDGATVFLPRTQVSDLQAVVEVAEHDGPWTVFGLYAPFDFGVTGYLAAVCEALARLDIPVLSLATYRRDFVLVPGARADEAHAALDALVASAGI